MLLREGIYTTQHSLHTLNHLSDADVKTMQCGVCHYLPFVRTAEVVLISLHPFQWACW